jgi:hypothetical protein
MAKKKKVEEVKEEVNPLHFEESVETKEEVEEDKPKKFVGFHPITGAEVYL